MRLAQVLQTGAAGICLIAGIQAHSWVEQLNLIAPNGTMIEPAGFPRGNVRRGMPNFGDDKMVWLIPPNSNPINQINADQKICRPEQRSQSQPDNSPRLKASPGASVALRYQENGHVTLPETQKGKPANRGTNFVYYTNKATPDDLFLQIHRVWSYDGKGGDGRGRLISTRPYDDGQCYQINGDKISQQRQTEFKKTADQLQGANLWCQQDVKIPDDATPGSTITLYWVWDWPTMPGTEGFPNGKQELYTTCMDIDVVAAGSTGAVAGVAKAAVDTVLKFVPQDLGNAAVASQFNDIANPTGVPQPAMIAFAGASLSPTTSVAGSVPTSSMSSLTSSGIATGDTSVSLAGSSTYVSAASTSQTVGATKPNAAAPETVTMTVTVTKSPETTSHKSKGSAVIVTKYETVSMVTMTVSQNMGATTLTSTPASTSTSASLANAAPNSKTDSIYRLRARAPFYVYVDPASSSSSSSSTPTGTGC